MRAIAAFLAPACLALLATSASAESDRDRPCRPCHFYGAMEGAPIIDPEAYQRSAHAQEGCIHCHHDIEDPQIEHEKPEQDLQQVSCSDCHEKQAAAHEASVHGSAHARNTGLAASVACADCHGVHDVRRASDADARTHPDNLAVTCARCHAGDAGHHGGAPDAATCAGCHGAHDTLPGYHPKSRIHRDNIAATCGACHAKASAAFGRSVHSRLAEPHEHKGASGVQAGDEIPVCIDCHSGHQITSAAAPAMRARLHTRCARCHGDQRHMAQHDMGTHAMSSYLDDFHGVSNALYATGSGAPASSVGTCTDCHGAHEIQSFAGIPAKDVRRRIADVCRGCHEKVPDHFADAWLSHETSFASAPLAVGVKWGYRILIPLIIFGLLAHIAVHLYAVKKGKIGQGDAQ